MSFVFIHARAIANSIILRFALILSPRLHEIVLNLYLQYIRFFSICQ
uniref:Uncharacterized protein n=1 Tax=Myoviridae sp. ct89I2 TaxID=2827662 RepID=A0A8S5TCF5_9CAUD|nr:MAG TPA: hypothetical protein [Myoviridae sp. ct89I2]